MRAILRVRTTVQFSSYRSRRSEEAALSVKKGVVAVGADGRAKATGAGHSRGRRPSIWRRGRKRALVSGLVKMSATCSVVLTYFTVMVPSWTFSRM
jgi:hypothetical protein